MTQEEKQLLLIDLCGRLPYGIKMSNINAIHNGLDLPPFTIDISDYETSNPLIIINSWLLPHLRPMSSMTEEEYKEFSKISGLLKSKEDNYFSNHLPEWGNSIITEKVMVRTIDWLNSHYFDYRGLIPMGLALEAPEGMYNY